MEDTTMKNTEHCSVCDAAYPPEQLVEFDGRLLCPEGSERMGAFIMRPEALMEEKMMQTLINSIAGTADDHLPSPFDCLLLLHSLRTIPVVW